MRDYDAFLENPEGFGFMRPFFQSAEGDDPRYENLEHMQTGEPTLDPWGGDLWVGKDRPGEKVLERAQETANEVERREGGELPGFELPNEADPGLQEADKRAAARGVNPGRRGGSGQLFDLARSQLGAPYVFGSAGPTSFDCSGFVKWLYSRVYGVALPHQALQQAAATKNVSREQLAPGDLIFYSYGRLGGQIDHVEVYMGGNRQIGTSNPTEDLDIDTIDWDSVHSFGRVVSDNIAPAAGGGKARKDKMLPKPEQGEQALPPDAPTELVPTLLDPDAETRSLLPTAVMTAMEPAEETWKVPAALKKGENAGIKRQLYQGFLDAGRADLARMVGTRDFDAWIRQESGWNVGVASPANNNGLRNDGLFQIWRGHSYNSNGQVGNMSPYEQAQIVAKYFGHLTPDKIRSYADAIRDGSYHGWG